MDFPDSALAGIAAFLPRRFAQLSFSISHAFVNVSDEPETNSTAVSSNEDSPDSATREFLFAEDYVIGRLVNFRARATSRDPQMSLPIVRHRSQAYFTGYSHSF